MKKGAKEAASAASKFRRNSVNTPGPPRVEAPQTLESVVNNVESAGNSSSTPNLSARKGVSNRASRSREARWRKKDDLKKQEDKQKMERVRQKRKKKKKKANKIRREKQERRKREHLEHQQMKPDFDMNAQAEIMGAFEATYFPRGIYPLRRIPKSE